MSEEAKPFCPECENGPEQPDVIDRRNFIRVVGEQGVGLLAAGGLAMTAPSVLADDTRRTPTASAARPRKPAEELVRLLHSTLTEEQRRVIVMPWEHGSMNGRATPTRLRMYNNPINRRIGEVFTRRQQEIIERTLRAISSDEEGYRRVTRNGTFDASGALQGCGVNIFGEPSGSRPYSWVFTGHHLTVRCDGNSEPDTAFGGPMYYGHSPDGYSQRNCFYYQTRSVLSVYDALDERQRQMAVIRGRNPGEGEPSIRFRGSGQAMPGIAISQLSRDQRQLVERVMRDVLSPFRAEDADEVMDIIRRNGGMERIHLAFYQDGQMNDNERWHFWRLEGPGFVWNYRVLPHVHTYVNIAARA
jgi:hypothetical protein